MSGLGVNRATRLSSCDESNLACLIDCVISGSTTRRGGRGRRSVAQLLPLASPWPRGRSPHSRTEKLVRRHYLEARGDRFKQVIVKLARGHVAPSTQ